MARTPSISPAPGAEPHDPPTSPGAPPGTPADPDPDDHTRPTVIPDGGPPPRLDFADPAAVKRWLDDLMAHVDDLAAAAEDQVAPPDERMLGPAKAREIIGGAYKALVQSIALARAGLPSPDSDSPTEIVVDVDLDKATVARVDALIPAMSTDTHRATRDDVIRAITKAGLPPLEASLAAKDGGP